MISPLANILETFRREAKTEREKGDYFEKLIKTYLLNEPMYRDLFGGQVYLWEEWRKYCVSQGNPDPGVDTGIDIVAIQAITDNPRIFAVQTKFYNAWATVDKKSIDSFLSAIGQQPYTDGILVITSMGISDHVTSALQKRDKPVITIDFDMLDKSQIDWSQYNPENNPETLPTLKPKKQLRDHQKNALEKVTSGLGKADRGKIIMACGSGKTFTALKIAETIAGAGGRVLFLVPSLNLLSQTLTEWTQESAIPLHSFAVCSDSEVGKKRKNRNDDTLLTMIHELQYPATTKSKPLASAISKRHDANHMSVVFSTYHSIETIAEAQKSHELADFDLIICDEAHRTTGATFSGEDESAFVKVHDNTFIRAAKRLYMTATPRIYSDTAKITSKEQNVIICSMDDESLYGKTLYTLSFSDAVRRELLCDYKVIVLSIDESHVSRRLQDLLKDENNQLKVHDAGKIIGCWKALAKQGITDALGDDSEPMRRAVAFCQVIEANHGGKVHKVSSKQIAAMFQSVIEAYQLSELDEERQTSHTLKCEVEHVDGGMSALEKGGKLAWLKEDAPPNTCRILSNVRCLSEGVDVPALDAVLFLTPRNSQVDVVQSVGRVMRKSPGKVRGYVILPVVIPAGMEPHEALNDNKSYQVVWQVLQALRSHDDRFDAMINKMEFGLNKKTLSKIEIIAVTDKLQAKSLTKSKKYRSGQLYEIGAAAKRNNQVQEEFAFNLGEIERAIYAKIVDKCGNRHHWEEWAGDIAKIANTHIDRITGILENPINRRERDLFDAFVKELRTSLNDSLPESEIIEMLAQHLITKPVFDALFGAQSFTKTNAVSKAMQNVVEVLYEHKLSKETDTLADFYTSVRERAEGIDDPTAKQRLVLELYDNFFRKAFPKMAKKLGIVYTPVEVVDFIIHSVNDILQNEFGETLGSEGVHIIEPFAGTGTFITRLLQSGLITPEQLPHKYQNELHANEILLLAYYIATINIESVYHSVTGGDYKPFEGICFTDTFRKSDSADLEYSFMKSNNTRRKRQDALDIKVIITNPPYSVGQREESDRTKRVEYPHLDERIREIYAKHSKAGQVRNLYDNYIRAIRWASDRIGNSGVIGLISGSGFIEKSAMDGMRKALAEEFSNIYLLNLRGDIRKNILSKGKAREGENIFGGNSMTGVAITLFVKNPDSAKHGNIYYHDIGDSLTTEEKRDKLTSFTSINGISALQGWKTIVPDAHGDWLRHRDDSFGNFIALGNKDKGSIKLFSDHSLGIVTNRDAWCYNPSNLVVENNMQRMISFYNDEVIRFNAAHVNRKDRDKLVDTFVSTDPTKISWSGGLKQKLVRNHQHSYQPQNLVISLYRPFTKQWLYFDRGFNEAVHQMPRIFPNSEAKNRVICVSGTGARSGFSALMVDTLPNLDFLEKSQCFPFYLYEKEPDTSVISQQDIFRFTPQSASQHTRHEAMTDEGLAHFRAAYPGENLSKEDIFYYIYGLLHSPDYREKYANNLFKELPRIPCVKRAEDFAAFSLAGRKLAELHIGYETVEPYPLGINTKDTLQAADYRVEQMKYGRNGKDKDLTTLHYNRKITLTGIPLEAYDYIVNGIPALDWVIRRQCVDVDKKSGIKSDANAWATETIDDPRYPLDLLCRIITVSVETMKIVKGLPPLDV